MLSPGHARTCCTKETGRRFATLRSSRSQSSTMPMHCGSSTSHLPAGQWRRPVLTESGSTMVTLNSQHRSCSIASCTELSSPSEGRRHECQFWHFKWCHHMVGRLAMFDLERCYKEAPIGCVYAGLNINFTTPCFNIVMLLMLNEITQWDFLPSSLAEVSHNAWAKGMVE